MKRTVKNCENANLVHKGSLVVGMLVTKLKSRMKSSMTFLSMLPRGLKASRNSSYVT
jgi:hypothetical protein